VGDRRQDWPWLPPALPGVPGVPGVGAGPGYGVGDGRESLSEALAQRLLAQRVVLLHGPLDDLTVTRVAAELMTLDAEGDDPVTLRVDCGEAGLAPALTLMDVIELMGVPVRALCLGQVAGGAIGVVALCAHRAAMPSTRFSVSEPATQLEAHVRNVAQWAELRAAERQRFCERVGAAVAKPADVVAADLTRGLFLGAAEAVEYGLLDEVSRPEAAIRRLPGSGSPGRSGPSGSSGPPPMGFRPLR
jgi:ATP-dependent Clp protease, protease subunit